MVTLSTLFLSANLTFNLPPGLLESICYVESKHQVNAIHHHDGDDSSYGVCQIKYKTAVWLGYKDTRAQLMSPKTNIYYAAKYLAWQRKRYKGSLQKAVIAYNMGHARITETVYSRRVFAQWRITSNE
jgi:soluble lytic murein transglycosylase-like protein